MITFTGIQMHPGCGKAPTPQDIAVGMCRITRYAGALWCPLAAHSVLVADYAYLASKDDVMWAYGLLHDAHETVTGETVRGYKTKAVGPLEDELDEAIFASFNLNITNYREARATIKAADEMALAAECTILGLKGWPEYYQKMNGKKPPVLNKAALNVAELTLMAWRPSSMVEEGSPQQTQLTMILENIRGGRLKGARVMGTALEMAKTWKS